MTLASVKCQFVVLEPVDPSGVPNGCLFLDSTNSNQATIKTTGGVNDPVTSTGTSFFLKEMVAGAAISSGQPLSKRSDGKVVEADSDGTGTQTFIGYSQESADGDGSLLNVLLAGANLSGVLDGLGFSTGDLIYLSESGGYTDDPDSFTGGDDTIIKLGIADCAASIASSTAVDLIAITDVLISP